MPVSVTVCTEKRLNAINNLSIAVRKLSEALASNVNVSIANNTIIGSKEKAAVSVDLSEGVTETKILEEDDF